MRSSFRGPLSVLLTTPSNFVAARDGFVLSGTLGGRFVSTRPVVVLKYACLTTPPPPPPGLCFLDFYFLH